MQPVDPAQAGRARPAAAKRFGPTLPAAAGVGSSRQLRPRPPAAQSDEDDGRDKDELIASAAGRIYCFSTQSMIDDWIGSPMPFCAPGWFTKTTTA